MTTTSTLVAFIPLALAIEQGGDMLQPMAAGAIGGLLMEVPVALLLMPCLYVLTSRSRQSRSDSVMPAFAKPEFQVQSLSHGQAH